MAMFTHSLYYTKDITMIQNYQDRIKVTKTKIKVTNTKSQCYIIQGYVWYQPQDLHLVRSLSALSRNLERHPNSRGSQPCCQLLSRESSKMFHIVCHIYGMKWFAHIQITCNGTGMYETPCTHNFIFSLINESWKKYLLFMC